jgi:hypothetical protein
MTGARSPKEVAQMNSTLLCTTARIPSSFGMPSSGHAFGVSAVVDGIRPFAALVVRERAAVTGAAKAGLRVAQTSIPGTSAWSPPTC